MGQMGQLIYLVEDDDSIRELIVYALTNSGYQVQGLSDGAALTKALTEATPQLFILDIMLPDEDGLSILSRLKQSPATANVPVIMLTAKTTEYDVIKGLDQGADDYIKKPFSVLELISRIKAVLRRTGTAPEVKPLSFHELTLDPQKRLVSVAGAEITLTFKEFELLAYLLENPGIVLSRDRIMLQVWGSDFAGESRTVDMHIKTLRHKLGSAGSYIETCRGVGYKIGD